MTVYGNYLCFCECLDRSGVVGSLMEIGSSNDSSKVNCKQDCKQGRFSRNILPEQLSGKNGFIKYASKVGPKVQYNLNGKTLALDLFSLVDFINAFQDPKCKSISKFNAVFVSDKKIVESFDNAMMYMNEVLIKNAANQIQLIQDLKTRNTTMAQLKLLETPVFKNIRGPLEVKSRSKLNEFESPALEVPFKRCESFDGKLSTSSDGAANSPTNSSNS